MRVITSYIGVIGSGKDYRANKLVEAGAVRIDFKDELLSLASDIAGYDVREDYDWFKEHIVGVRRPSNRFQEAFAVMDRNEFAERHPDLMTGRRLLTRLGTEGMRKRDKDYWVKQWALKAGLAVLHGKDVVSADCRFINEVSAIEKMPADKNFVFCNFRSERYNPTLDHASEKLAQTLLGLGLSDGDKISLENFMHAEKILNGVLEKTA